MHVAYCIVYQAFAFTPVFKADRYDMVIGFNIKIGKIKQQEHCDSVQHIPY